MDRCYRIIILMDPRFPGKRFMGTMFDFLPFYIFYDNCPAAESKLVTILNAVSHNNHLNNRINQIKKTGHDVIVGRWTKNNPFRAVDIVNGFINESVFSPIFKQKGGKPPIRSFNLCNSIDSNDWYIDVGKLLMQELNDNNKTYDEFVNEFKNRYPQVLTDEMIEYIYN